MSNYQAKYLKYKTKYITLKKELDGGGTATAGQKLYISLQFIYKISIFCI